MELASLEQEYRKGSNYLKALVESQGTICEYEMNQGDFENLMGFVAAANELAVGYK